ncbi:Mov34/MPN/PAD-1 family protein [Candidatus Woesearchaeota archaeon]|nr:Mov34/MPN/PAD-1 family protein [Candidatus Woesearchaeota archaeon]
MTLKTFLINQLKKFFGFDKYEFDKIIVEKEVVEKIIDLAKQAYPKEFVVLLEGEFKNKELIINDVLFNTYQASNNATSMTLDLPITSKIIGTAHSHPGYSSRPSGADLTFFNKCGIAHIIIAYPFNADTIRMYNVYGNAVGFSASI